MTSPVIPSTIPFMTSSLTEPSFTKPFVKSSSASSSAKSPFANSASALSLPNLTPEHGIGRYLSDIQKFSVLAAEEEYMLAKRWHDNKDLDAAHRLVTSHLRLVAKIARGYRGYGLPFSDLIAEGNVGLMRAVKGFDPERGFRLSTYAMWWIRAAITEYVLRSWSLVKIGTVAAQKKLFFGLNKIKKKLGILSQTDLSPEDAARVSEALDVPETDVVAMNQRLSAKDSSLNAPVGADESGEYIDLLPDETANLEDALAEQDEQDYRGRFLTEALKTLNDRERHIIQQRRLRDDPLTLEALAQQYGVSRERVRQIEARAFEKLRQGVLAFSDAADNQASAAASPNAALA